MKNFQRISPMVWFDHQAEEAAKFYTSIFPNSKICHKNLDKVEGNNLHHKSEGAPISVTFELDGFKFAAVDGGLHLKLNPSISFFVTYDSLNQIDAVWDQLAEGATILMPLDRYKWSNKYGWLEDRYGISWQISLGNTKDTNGHNIIPFFTFVKEHHGQAEEAIKFYTSIFRSSLLDGIRRYGSEAFPEREGTVEHAQFILAGQTFMAMDSALEHPFTFNEAISLIVSCDTQEEIAYYQEKLSEGADSRAENSYGLLKDKFGVSWRLLPTPNALQAYER